MSNAVHRAAWANAAKTDIVTGVGWRTLPHTADTRFQAWAPSREECLVEAVTALVSSFVDTTGARPTDSATARMVPGNDEDLLVDVLDEVIYLLETTGRVPVTTEIGTPDGDRSDDGQRDSDQSYGLVVRFGTVDVDQLTPVGAAPKAVALHDLHFSAGSTGSGDAGGWSCTVTVDV